MDQETNRGVTEARFALTIVTCALVAIGYIVLLRLGGSGETVEIGPNIDPPPATARDERPAESDDQPKVLTVEANDAASSVRTSPLPGDFAPTQSDGTTATRGNSAAPIDSTDSQRR